MGLPFVVLQKQKLSKSKGKSIPERPYAKQGLPYLTTAQRSAIHVMSKGTDATGA
jgi:hypothetical protein